MSRQSGGCGRAGGGVDEARLHLRAGLDSVDSMSAVSLMSQEVDVITLSEQLNDLKVRPNKVKRITLNERQHLAFVRQRVYNLAPVSFTSKAEKDVSMCGRFIEYVCLQGKAQTKHLTGYKLPENSTIAYGLKMIHIEDGVLDIPIDHTRSLTEEISLTSRQILQWCVKDITDKEVLLQPLAGLPESTRGELLRTLRQLLEDGDALSQLEDTMDQCSDGASERPQSQLAASFMDLLDVSQASSALRDAAHLLVNIMKALPDGLPALLSSCSLDTLEVFKHMVDSLKKDGQAQLPRALPRPLQEDGELRRAAYFLCLTDHLADMRDDWEFAELRPGDLLEVLCLAVLGLSLLQTHCEA
ncbi:uncharacterized protein LOC114443892 isoform X2 [Parambassis ranga]|nr:uncharacterized protein LOC114443892 isoform X2 [Parambassis ranga]